MLPLFLFQPHLPSPNNQSLVFHKYLLNIGLELAKPALCSNIYWNQSSLNCSNWSCFKHHCGRVYSYQSMVEPHLRSSPSPKGNGTINRLISQWLSFNSISIWFFLPRASVTPVVSPSTPEPSNLDPPLLHTLVPLSFIKLLNPRIKKEKGGGGRGKKGIRRKIMRDMEKGNRKKIKKMIIEKLKSSKKNRRDF